MSVWVRVCLWERARVINRRYVTACFTHPLRHPSQPCLTVCHDSIHFDISCSSVQPKKSSKQEFVLWPSSALSLFSFRHPMDSRWKRCRHIWLQKQKLVWRYCPVLPHWCLLIIFSSLKMKLQTPLTDLITPSQQLLCTIRQSSMVHPYFLGVFDCLKNSYHQNGKEGWFKCLWVWYGCWY